MTKHQFRLDNTKNVSGNTNQISDLKQRSGY